MQVELVRQPVEIENALDELVGETVLLARERGAGEAKMRKSLKRETCLLNALAVVCYAAALACVLACCYSMCRLALPSLERGVVAVTRFGA